MIRPIYYDTQPILPPSNSQSTTTSTNDFAQILEKAQNKVEFSKHAQQRLMDRELNFTADDIANLENTVSKMAAMGARESLIYLNNTALVVSVPNRTVITAMDGDSLRDNIFTNIDSAAII